MKTINVVAAIIRHDNQILCVQRQPHQHDYISRKYEFPGGKVEPGESHEMALYREIDEELSLPIHIVQHFLTVTHQYPDFHITMHSFLCTAQTRSLTLVDHIDHQWLNHNDLQALDWAAADIPIVEKLLIF